MCVFTSVCYVICLCVCMSVCYVICLDMYVCMRVYFLFCAWMSCLYACVNVVCIFAQKLVLILWVKCFADDHGTMQVTKYYLLIQVQTCLVVCVEQPWFHQTRCGVCHQPPSPEYGCLPGSQQAPDTDMQSECCFYLLPQHVSSNILAHLPSPVFHHWVYQRKKKKKITYKHLHFLLYLFTSVVCKCISV